MNITHDANSNLALAKVGNEYTVKSICTDDTEMEDFLLTLGCYEGQKLTLVSVLSENYIIAIESARYTINQTLAQTILI